MTWNHRLRLPYKALALAAVLVLPPAPVALADASSGSAQGSVQIADPVGTGIAFDLLSQTLSGIFLAGRAGDAVSLFLPRGQQVPDEGGSEVIVLSSSTFQLPMGYGRDMISATGAKNASGNDKVGAILVLAQFN